MGGKKRKLQLKQQAAGRARAAFIPNRHSDKPLAAAGPLSGANTTQKKQPPPSQKQQSKKMQEQRQRQRQHNQENPTIPFDADDRILLVGEGDLSFAASLVRHHRCRHVTASVLDRDHAELVAKYPSADANIAVFHGLNPEPKKAEEKQEEGDATADDAEPASSSAPEPAAALDGESDSDADYDADGNHRPRAPKTNRLLYAVDATKLPPSLTRAPPRFDRILFNFPHVGGKSTDVNRQVRYNQELLVGFFQRALPALAPGGSVIVTLFEGEPYTLWNVRDLARHVGLQADTSFRFQAAAYPGYHHARTLGVVKSKKGGAWRGEDRTARSYVFVRKGDTLRKTRGEQQQQQQQRGQKKKRKRESDDESESSEDDLDD